MVGSSSTSLLNARPRRPCARLTAARERARQDDARADPNQASQSAQLKWAGRLVVENGARDLVVAVGVVVEQPGGEGDG